MIDVFVISEFQSSIHVALAIYTSAILVCEKVQTKTLSITESKHLCFLPAGWSQTC